MYLNSNYKNIFEFDFTVEEYPQDTDKDAVSKDIEELKALITKELLKRTSDSIKVKTVVKIDTVYKEVITDNLLLDSISSLNAKLNSAVNITEKITDNAEKKANEKSFSEEWVKKTAKLIEAMNAKNAAKVLQKYSDNEAREIIYAMKKNKAAEILSQLDPVFVNRITKAQI